MNSDILDRPIAFHRCFVTLTGSVNAALMLSQAVYWQKRNKDAGWWYQTQAKWEDETGLSRREQDTARRDLRGKPFWNEELKGLPGKMHYSVDLEILMDCLEEIQSPQTSLAESAKQDGAIPPNSIGVKRQASNKEKRLKEETKEDAQPSVRVNFIAQWCLAFEKQFLMKYEVSGKDAGAVKIARLGATSASEVERLIHAAVCIWKRSGWLSKRCVTIHGFLNSKNEVNVELATPLKGQFKTTTVGVTKVEAGVFNDF
jgi:hypothetical protein